MAIEKKIKDQIRANETALYVEWLKSRGLEPMYTAAGTIYYELDGVWIKNSHIIPNASEEEATDGYSLAEEYQMKQEAAADRKAKAEKKAAEQKAKAAAKLAAKLAE